MMQELKIKTTDEYISILSNKQQKEFIKGEEFDLNTQYQTRNCIKDKNPLFGISTHDYFAFN